MRKFVRSVGSHLRRHAAAYTVAGLCVAAASARADGTGVDTDIQGAITSGTATFTAVKGLAITIVTFVIGWRLVKRFAK